MEPKFKTAIIDPPWPYGKASNNNKNRGYVSQEGNQKYPTMLTKDLASLPVGKLIEDYIFLWVVGPFIKEALDLIDAWGFIYRSQLCWHKTTGYGVGYWFRGDHELIFVASKKGSEAKRTNERSLFGAPRTRHSSKPDNIHKIVEKHFPGPYLELFGRNLRENWTVLGNEAPEDGKDIRESISILLEN